MSLRKRRRSGDLPQPAIEMNSLMDLVFILLITFIITLPELEQGVSIMLPKAKTDELPTKNRKANSITCQYPNGYFLNEEPMTLDKLEERLKAMAAEDPEVPVLIRGDERLDYGAVMDVVKIVYNCKIHRMSLVTVQK